VVHGEPGSSQEELKAGVVILRFVVLLHSCDYIKYKQAAGYHITEILGGRGEPSLDCVNGGGGGGKIK